MSNKPLNISDEAKVQMPMKTVLSLLSMEVKLLLLLGVLAVLVFCSAFGLPSLLRRLSALAFRASFCLISLFLPHPSCRELMRNLLAGGTWITRNTWARDC